MKWQNLKDEPCAIARTLAVIGDRWTLMVVRDAFLGVRRFDEFHARLKISKALLTDRLTALVEAGIFQKVDYCERPPRQEYRLTPQGMDLYPILLAMAAWGDRYQDGGAGPPLIHRHRACGHDFKPVMTCSCCAEPVHAREVEVRAGLGFADPRAKHLLA